MSETDELKARVTRSVDKIFEATTEMRNIMHLIAELNIQLASLVSDSNDEQLPPAITLVGLAAVNGEAVIQNLLYAKQRLTYYRDRVL